MTDTHDFVGSEPYAASVYPQASPVPSLVVTLTGGELHRYFDVPGQTTADPADAPTAHAHDYVVDGLRLLHVVHSSIWPNRAPKVETVRTYAAGSWRFVQGHPLAEATGMWTPEANGGGTGKRARRTATTTPPDAPFDPESEGLSTIPEPIRRSGSLAP